ncbi:putative type IV pilin precursor (prepilin) [Allomeiothermus silvanus DSM 9946]|uniref:Type IV pilin (Prepilin) n=1 Tax=Allomeiothermus silvanus (strain ATCC 700542 / DSM 9946 / NBRC 106475 / NCIMB 13440 / VI-R2) TaxID=526227 RepID=D7BC04_ALLS1|nr:prepilin-type N-terminal cleavage/methylation domain-containing protein [Allomeiothermus silvanus]ADH62800.1 putative type IV pilin precursor (prepilin) [Allomeiothermus silvanus DSM 9946]
MRRVGGFTLPELLVAVAIIAILAAVLLPNLLQSRKRSMETAARLYLKQVIQWIAMVDTKGADASSLDGGDCKEPLLQSEGAPAQYPKGIQSCHIVRDPSDNRYIVTVTDATGQSISAIYWLR